MIKRKIFYSLILLLLLTSPSAVLAQWQPDIDLGDTGLPSGAVTDIIFNIMEWLLGIFAAIGIIGFVIAGILYLTAAGNEDQIGKAKKAMTWSIVGVVVGLVGLVILFAVTNLLNAEYWF